MADSTSPRGRMRRLACLGRFRSRLSGLAGQSDGHVRFGLAPQSCQPAPRRRRAIVSGYRRSFDPGGSKLGDSLLADLTTDVVLYESADAADKSLGGISSALTGGDVGARFADIVRASVGIEASKIEGQTLFSKSLGDGAVVSHATFDTQAG